MPSDGEQDRRLSRLVAELADEDAGRLIDEARVTARKRVLEMLTDALVDALRERVLERVGAPPPAQMREVPEPEASDWGWYVHGVIAAAEARAIEDVAGIDPGHTVRAISEGALAAVVSPVRLEEFGEARLREHLSDMGWVEATARAHDLTLERLCRRTTVVPMRMCSVYRAEGGVRELLRREERALADACAHLTGKTEWGVKVFADAGLRRQPAGDEPSADDARAGTAYLARKRDERDAGERADALIEQAAQQIHQRLCAAAADGGTVPAQQLAASGHRAEMVLNGVYLVPDVDEAKFHEELRALQETFGPIGFALEETGPWPAYNFVPGAIGAAW